MNTNSRYQEILKILTKLRTVAVTDLTERLNVSEVTVRKDLTALEEKGLLVRTHGRAELAEDMQLLRPVQIRKKENLEVKRAIAKKAVELIREGDTIYLDSGTTCTFIAEQIKKMSLRVVTNSIDVMNMLSDEFGITLILVGGNYRQEAGAFVGPMAINNVRNFHIQTCFIGATSFDSDGVFSSQNLLESELKNEVLQISSRRVIVADSGKYGKRAFSVFARPKDLDILITSNDFEDTTAFHSLNIEILKPGRV